MSSNQELDDSIRTLAAGTISNDADTATTEFAAQTIRSRFSEMATSAGQPIGQAYHDMMRNPDNPVMMTLMSAAAESNAFSNECAQIFYLCHAFGAIVGSSETKDEQEAMQGDLTAEQPQLLARVTQHSDSFSVDLEAARTSLEDIQSRNSHFSWEQGTRD